MMLGFKPIPNVSFVCGDMTEKATIDKALSYFNDETVSKGFGLDVILSDMSPRISGIKVRDQAAAARLMEACLTVVEANLKPAGAFVCKYFCGSEMAAFRSKLAESFGKVHVYKPDATRKESAEIYFVCLNHKAIKYVAEKWDIFSSPEEKQ